MNETVLDSTRQQLESLQVRTIFTLVEDIELEVGGVSSTKKLLFITNKQSRMFDLGDVDRFMQAFDINPKPKLIINLFNSFAYHCGSEPYDFHWSLSDEGFGDHQYHAETSDEKLHDTDRKIAHFLKECVLPVAIEANALVILHNNACSLAMLFSKVRDDLFKTR